jgi:hypothetical protein
MTNGPLPPTYPNQIDDAQALGTSMCALFHQESYRIINRPILAESDILCGKINNLLGIFQASIAIVSEQQPAGNHWNCDVIE